MNKLNKLFLILGLGIGLLISSLLNIAYPKIKYESYSEEQIIEKAKELGMVSLKEVVSKNDDKDDNKELTSEDISFIEDEKNNNTELNKEDISSEDEKIKNTEIDDKDNSSTDSKKAKNTEPISKNSSSADSKKSNNTAKLTNKNTSPTQNNITLTNQDTSPISNEKDDNTVLTNEGASLTDNIRFVINKGDSCRKIANNLFEKGIIKSKEEFTKRVLERNLQDRFQPGNFELRSDMDYDTIISILTSK